MGNQYTSEGFFDRADPEAQCGCSNCQRLFAFKDIADFWDEGDTPVCPFCGMDTVVVETADMNVTAERLKAMRRTY